MKKATPGLLLEASNEEYVRSNGPALAKSEEVRCLLLLLSQLFDYLAEGGDAYVTFTANRKRTECMLVLGQDGEKTYVTARSLQGLLTAVPQLL